jgi:hypothetical protein
VQPSDFNPPPAGGFNPPPTGGYAPQPAGAFTPPPVGQYAPKPPTPTSTEAILALVLAIVGFTTSCFPAGLVAVYFGAKARRVARESGEPNNTNATLGLIGMILGGIFGALYGLFWIGYALILVGAIVMGALSH